MKRIVLSAVLAVGLGAGLVAAPVANAASTAADEYFSIEATPSSVTVKQGQCKQISFEVYQDVEQINGNPWDGFISVTDPHGNQVEYFGVVDADHTSKTADICYKDAVTGTYKVDFDYLIDVPDEAETPQFVPGNLRVTFSVNKVTPKPTRIKLQKVERWNGSASTSAVIGTLYKDGRTWGKGHRIILQCKAYGEWYDIKSQKTNGSSMVGWTINHVKDSHYTCRLEYLSNDTSKVKTSQSKNFLLDFWRH